MTEKALVQNAADEEQVKSAGQKVRFKEDRDLNDLRVVMSTTQGRRVIWRILNGLCHVDSVPTYTEEKNTYLALGEMLVGKRIKEDLHKSSDLRHAWRQMEDEYYDAKEKGL